MPLLQVCLVDVAACAPWRANSKAARRAGAIMRDYLFCRSDVVQKRYSIVTCMGHDAYRSPRPPEMLPSSSSLKCCGSRIPHRGDNEVPLLV